jgi:16S rRNA (uracil1498-N3)-methyltransferase
MSDLFYVPPVKIRGNTLSFSIRESRHIRTSCRRGVGDILRVTDGMGSILAVEITRSAKIVEGRILERKDAAPESLTIDLAVGMSKRERMSWLVEKGTEIGMNGFFPLITAWSSARRHREEWKTPVDRWRRVAIAALKQSGRYHLPDITSPRPLDQFLKMVRNRRYDQSLLLDRGEKSRPLRELLKERKKRFLVLLGPEGGFTPLELDRIDEEGFVRARLIDRPLRFETAGLSAVALIALHGSQTTT